MIIVKDLHKSFEDNQVLKGVNYHIHPGEKIVVVGPSGSGKSTFLRCLNLLERPTSGEIWFDGQNITDPRIDINKVRQHMGMVFQHFNLFNNLTIMNNITLAPVKLKLMGEEEERECPEAVKESWTGGKGRCLSGIFKRRSEAENCNCQISGNESQSNAV